MVPSSDQRTLPSMKILVGTQYVLMRMVASDGHKCRTLRRAACLLRELKALLASIRRTASVSSLEKIDFIVCIAPLYLQFALHTTV